MSRNTKILLFGSSLWYLGEGMLGPLFAVFAQRIGGDILEITWAWAIYLIVFGALTMLVGGISDRIGKEKMMIIGYWLNAVLTFAYLFVHDAFGLFVLQAGLGVAAALATPTWDALYDHYSGDDSEGTVWGVADGLPKMATGLAIVAGGMIVDAFSFAALFVIMGCVQVVSSLVQSMIFFSGGTRSAIGNS